jgi:hypothetical protein
MNSIPRDEVLLDQTSKLWQNLMLAATVSRKPIWTGDDATSEMIFYNNNDACGNMQSHSSL